MQRSMNDEKSVAFTAVADTTMIFSLGSMRSQAHRTTPGLIYPSRKKRHSEAAVWTVLHQSATAHCCLVG